MKKVKQGKRTLRAAMIDMMQNEELQNNLLQALFEKASGGDIRAFEVIRDLIGEKGKTEQDESVDKIKIEVVELNAKSASPKKKKDSTKKKTVKTSDNTVNETNVDRDTFSQ